MLIVILLYTPVYSYAFNKYALKEEKISYLSLLNKIQNNILGYLTKAGVKYRNQVEDQILFH